MEVILLERVGQARPDGRRGARQGRLRPQFPVAARQGAARHRGKSHALRNHEERARGPLADAQDRSRRRRRKTQRQELHGAAPSLRERPAVRLGFAARPRRPDQRAQASPSTAIRSRSTRRSRRSVSTTCRLRCIRRSKPRSASIVARNNDEAARIARGEDVTRLREEPTEAEAAVDRRGSVLRAGGRGIGAGARRRASRPKARLRPTRPERDQASLSSVRKWPRVNRRALARHRRVCRRHRVCRREPRCGRRGTAARAFRLRGRGSTGRLRRLPPAGFALGGVASARSAAGSGLRRLARFAVLAARRPGLAPGRRFFGRAAMAGPQASARSLYSVLADRGVGFGARAAGAASPPPAPIT